MGTFRFGNNIGERKLAAYYTLGCKLNYAETSTIARQLQEMGIETAGKGETPDICVINTCSVTETADKKARNLIRRINRRNPGALIVVTGCYAQLKPREVASLPGVGIVVGTNDKGRIPTLIESHLSADEPFDAPAEIVSSVAADTSRFDISCARGERTRFFLKVQDGCDYFCTYCTIPYARGRSRSGFIEDIVAEARRAADEGGKEIVLTGVNIGDFGKNTGENFFDLIRRLDTIEGIERFRISSIEPNLLTDEIIEWVAEGSRAFMPHFHIPLQSGSDAVLRKMNRRYDTALFRHRLEKIKSLLPHAFIGVDVIVGARGETPEEWESSKNFIASLPVSRLHIFPYSERPGTAALLLGDIVEKRERNRRVEELLVISDIKLSDFLQSNIGSRRKVLWEHKTLRGNLMTGLTDNYIKVVAPVADTLENHISEVRLTSIADDFPETIIGEPEG